MIGTALDVGLETAKNIWNNASLYDVCPRRFQDLIDDSYLSAV